MSKWNQILIQSKRAYFTSVVSTGWSARTANTGVNWSCRQSLFTLTSARLARFAKLKFQNMHTFSRTCTLIRKILLAISVNKSCSSIWCLVPCLHYHAARGKVAHKPQTNTSPMKSNLNPIRRFYYAYFTFTVCIIQQHYGTAIIGVAKRSHRQ